MTIPIQLITAKISQLANPHNNILIEPNTDIDAIYYEGNKLIITFTFPQLQSTNFRTFQRDLLKLLKQDLHIPHIQLNYFPQQEQPVKESLPLFRTKYPHATCIVYTTRVPNINSAERTISYAEYSVQIGNTVALIDLDITHGAIPNLLNMSKDAPKTIDNMLVPFLTPVGFDLMSTQLLIREQRPMTWRPEMAHLLIEQMLYHVAWNAQTDIFLFHLPAEVNYLLHELINAIPDSQIEVLEHETK